MTHEEVFASIATEVRSLPRAAADLVPAPDQVPRRAAPEVGPAARARVRDEGLVLARPRPRRARSRLPAPLRRVPPDLRALRARAARGRGVVGRDGRLRVDRVHGGERRGRGLGRVVRRLRLRGEPREGDVAAGTPPTTSAGPAAPEKFATPGVRTHRDLANFAGGAPPSARSRRSSTCSTAQRRSCCCAAITRSRAEARRRDGHA